MTKIYDNLWIFYIYSNCKSHTQRSISKIIFLANCFFSNDSQLFVLNCQIAFLMESTFAIDQRHSTKETNCFLFTWQMYFYQHFTVFWMCLHSHQLNVDSALWKPSRSNYFSFLSLVFDEKGFRQITNKILLTITTSNVAALAVYKPPTVIRGLYTAALEASLASDKQLACLLPTCFCSELVWLLPPRLLF